MARRSRRGRGKAKHMGGKGRTTINSPFMPMPKGAGRRKRGGKSRS